MTDKGATREPGAAIRGDVHATETPFSGATPGAQGFIQVKHRGHRVFPVAGQADELKPWLSFCTHMRVENGSLDDRYDLQVVAPVLCLSPCGDEFQGDYMRSCSS